MKYLIFGDIHGKDMDSLKKEILAEQPDSLICLGDFDGVKSIREYMDIEKEFLKQGKEVYKVPGNHDFALAYGDGIKSATFEAQTKNMHDYYIELKRDPKAKKFIQDLADSDFYVRGNLDEGKFGEKYPFVVVHGGYTGDLESCLGCGEGSKPLWYRMKNEEDFHFNANEMRLRGEKIMIRGHDHFPAFSVNDAESTERELHFPIRGNKFKINSKKEQIINPGSYFYKDFAVINTSGEVPEIEYKKDTDPNYKLQF